MRIRILLAIRPRIMREVIWQMIEQQEDMEVIDEVVAPIDPLAAVGETGADVLIVTIGGPEELDLFNPLLAEHPNLIVLSLESSGKTAFVRKFCSPWQVIVDPSEVAILGVLRHGAKIPCDPEEGVG